jgi:hypothetical protein
MRPESNLPRRPSSWRGCLALLVVALLAATPAATAQEPPGKPGARWGHAMAYDAARDRVVLFGGALSREQYVADTWEWNGASWTRIDAAGPPPRAFAAMAFDSSRNRVVLHGGRDPSGDSLADTWEWDGRAWRQVATAGPARRDHHALVFDETRKVTLLFGGYGDDRVYGDTWTWNGAAWKQVATAGPPPRAAHAMAFDRTRGRIVAHGGVWLGGIYADIWEWTGQKWSGASEPYANRTFDHHALAFDAKRGRMLVFGGKDFRSAAIKGLFEIKGRSVVAVTEEGPSARYNSGFVYDERRGVVFVFGGRTRAGESSYTGFADSWTWDGSAWTEVGR